MGCNCNKAQFATTLKVGESVDIKMGAETIVVELTWASSGEATLVVST